MGTVLSVRRRTDEEGTIPLGLHGSFVDIENQVILRTHKPLVWRFEYFGSQHLYPLLGALPVTITTSHPEEPKIEYSGSSYLKLISLCRSTFPVTKFRPKKLGTVIIIKLALLKNNPPPDKILHILQIT